MTSYQAGEHIPLALRQANAGNFIFGILANRRHGIIGRCQRKTPFYQVWRRRVKTLLKRIDQVGRHDLFAESNQTQCRQDHCHRVWGRGLQFKHRVALLCWIRFIYDSYKLF